jgi:hypothetical protein
MRIHRSLAFAALLLATGVALSPAHDAVGAAKNRAGLVVRYSDGTVDKMCVFFDEPTISGLDLLERSGETFVAERSGLGSAICKIDEQGCDYPGEDCFCKYPNFWGYWVRDPGESVWRFADTGAKDHEVRNGSVDGWSWGPNGAPAPPLIAFDQVCPASQKLTATTSSKPARTDEPRSSEPSRTTDSTSGPRTDAGSSPGGSPFIDKEPPGSAASPTQEAIELPAPLMRPRNYLGFVAFALLFVLAGGGLWLLRRRRA